MHVEMHDEEGRINVEDLTAEGAREAILECQNLIVELQTHIEEEESGA